MSKEWEKIREEIVYSGYRRIFRRFFILPDGRQSEFDIIMDGDTVCVLALTPDNKVILTEQFRQGPEVYCLELPGGGIEENEKPEDAAKRELLEETGFKGDIQLAGTNLHDAYSNTTRYNFVALNCIKDKNLKLDKDEFVKVVEMDLKDFREHVKKGQFTDVGSAYMALDYLGEL